jgi:PIN domain nuclease of toxin-antitoxin system
VTLLLDTHVLIWWLAEPRRLSPGAHAAIADGANLVFVSAASAWEMGIKARLGKLNVPDDLEEQLRRERFTELPVRIAHARESSALPPLHRDPFDRMLVAQSRIESLTLVTADPLVLAYGGRTLRA